MIDRERLVAIAEEAGALAMARWPGAGHALDSWDKAPGNPVSAADLEVDGFLRSTSHDNVFGAGDIASIVGEPRARSGVYAVRAGPPLATNLIRRAQGKPLRSYTPQRSALYLLATGRKHAIASWNGLSWQGDWVWRWKDRIDRGFITAFRTR